MSLRHAILGFLSHQPFTGYDLKRAFDSSVRHFWTADRAQIYRTLADLEAAGLVTHERVPQEDRPDRKVQHLTAAGHAELSRWLAAPTEIPPSREPFLLKLFLSDRMDPAGRDALIAAERARAEAGVAALHRVAAALRAEPGEHSLGPILSLHAGLSATRAWAEWLAHLQGRLASDPAPDALVQTLLAELGG